jgi:hypothetical protein
MPVICFSLAGEKVGLMIVLDLRKTFFFDKLIDKKSLCFNGYGNTSAASIYFELKKRVERSFQNLKIVVAFFWGALV